MVENLLGVPSPLITTKWHTIMIWNVVSFFFVLKWAVIQGGSTVLQIYKKILKLLEE